MISNTRTCEKILRRVQSSPGYLQVGHVPSNWTRHIPHTSSSGMSHRQDATAFHCLMMTFIVAVWLRERGLGGSRDVFIDFLSPTQGTKLLEIGSGIMILLEYLTCKVREVRVSI